jgi:putative phosphoesterase
MGTAPSKIIVAGDLVGYGPKPNEVIDLVEGIGALSIRGNHDQSVIDCDYSRMNPHAAEAARWTSRIITPNNLKRLNSLRRFEIIEIEGRRIGLHHGSPEDPDEYVMDESRAKELLRRSDFDIIVCGHTHVPMLVSQNGKLFLNPGSVGQPRDGNPAAAFMELDLRTLRAVLHRIEYSIEITQEEMSLEGLPKFLIDRLAKGY